MILQIKILKSEFLNLFDPPFVSFNALSVWRGFPVDAATEKRRGKKVRLGQSRLALLSPPQLPFPDILFRYQMLIAQQQMAIN